jgi:hypothetical protein
LERNGEILVAALDVVAGERVFVAGLHEQLQLSPVTILTAHPAPHRVFQVAKLAKDSTEDPADRFRHPVADLSVGLLRQPAQGCGHQWFHLTHRIAEYGVNLSIKENAPAPGGLQQPFEGDPPSDLIAVPRRPIEVVQVGDVIDDRRTRPTHHGDTPAVVRSWSHLKRELHPAQEGGPGRDRQTHPVWGKGGDQLGVGALHHLDAVVSALYGSSTAPLQVVDQLPEGDSPNGVGIQVPEVNRGAGPHPGPASLCELQFGDGAASIQVQAMGLVPTFRPGHHIAAPPQLLKGEQADGLLAQGAWIPLLLRFEEAPGHPAQLVRVHPRAFVIHRYQGMAALAPQHHCDPATPTIGRQVGVRGVGDELVERVLGILVGLAGDQHRLGEVPYAKLDLLRHAQRS